MAGAGPSVAVVDIVKVFDHHTRFKQQMESIKQEIEAFDREVAGQQEAIRHKAEQLAAMPSGAERNQLEAQITRQQADLQVKAQLKRNEILEREARIYYETYKEVVDRVGELAVSSGISLVLRYDSTPIDPQDRGSVLKGVNRSVVMQHQLDLTDAVIHNVVSANPAPAAPRTPQTGTPPRAVAPLDRQSMMPPSRIGRRIPFSSGLSN